MYGFSRASATLETQADVSEMNESAQVSSREQSVVVSKQARRRRGMHKQGEEPLQGRWIGRPPKYMHLRPLLRQSESCVQWSRVRFLAFIFREGGGLREIAFVRDRMRIRMRGKRKAMFGDEVEDEMDGWWMGGTGTYLYQ